eukprot:284637-Rhodomonas_salina.2
MGRGGDGGVTAGVGGGRGQAERARVQPVPQPLCGPGQGRSQPESLLPVAGADGPGGGCRRRSLCAGTR